MGEFRGAMPCAGLTLMVTTPRALRAHRGVPTRITSQQKKARETGTAFHRPLRAARHPAGIAARRYLRGGEFTSAAGSKETLSGVPRGEPSAARAGMPPSLGALVNVATDPRAVGATRSPLLSRRRVFAELPGMGKGGIRVGGGSNPSSPSRPLSRASTGSVGGGSPDLFASDGEAPVSGMWIGESWPSPELLAVDPTIPTNHPMVAHTRPVGGPGRYLRLRRRLLRRLRGHPGNHTPLVHPPRHVQPGDEGRAVRQGVRAPRPGRRGGAIQGETPLAQRTEGDHGDVGEPSTVPRGRSAA